MKKLLLAALLGAICVSAQAVGSLIFTATGTCGSTNLYTSTPCGNGNWNSVVNGSTKNLYTDSDINCGYHHVGYYRIWADSGRTIMLGEYYNSTYNDSGTRAVNVNQCSTPANTNFQWVACYNLYNGNAVGWIRAALFYGEARAGGENIAGAGENVLGCACLPLNTGTNGYSIKTYWPKWTQTVNDDGSVTTTSDGVEIGPALAVAWYSNYTGGCTGGAGPNNVAPLVAQGTTNSPLTFATNSITSGGGATGALDSTLVNLANAVAKDSTLQKVGNSLFEAIADAAKQADDNAKQIIVNTANALPKLDSIKTSIDTGNGTLTSIKTSVDGVTTAINSQNSGTNGTALNTSNMVVRLDKLIATNANISAFTKTTAEALAALTNLTTTGNVNLAGIKAAAETGNGYLSSISTLSSGINSTLQSINSAVTDDSIKQAYYSGTNHGDMQLLQGVTGQGLSNVVGALNSGLGSISNLLAGMGTNENGDVVGAVEAFHVDNTNLLGQILGVLSTNFNPYTNNGMISEAEATALGTAAMAGPTASAQGLIDGLGSAPSGEGAGGAGVFAIAFAGTTLNLDPEARVPGAMAFVKNLIALVATIFFVQGMGKCYMQTVGSFASARQMSLPNLEVLGTNALGAIVAPIMTTILIAVWVVVFTAFFAIFVPGDVLGHLSMPSVPNIGGGSGDGARYLLYSSVPVALLLSYAWTTMVMHFKMGVCIGIASAISRYLVG